MGKTKYKELRGSQILRQKLVLATLSRTPVRIDDIRPNTISPGLRPYEKSLLDLLEKICDDCFIDINETGTSLKYKPGIVMGGRNLEHDCGLTRSIGYFLEPLILLALFGRKPLSIKLKGITNDSKDPSVDTFQSTTLPMLKRFGVNPDDVNLKIESRGVPPLGGGEVILTIPTVKSFSAVSWTDEGMVKRIRGVSFSTRVSSQFEHAMITAARGVFNRLLPDVHIGTDHRKGPRAGNSPGFGISLVAETTTNCLISIDTAVSYGYGEEITEFEEEKQELPNPEDVGEGMAYALLNDIGKGGVVDSTHQGLLFLLCALCPNDVSKVRVGEITPYGIETLRNIYDFLKVMFHIEPDPSSQTVLLKCVGFDLKNFSMKHF
ncbi:putative RNA 3'-terminal phosphate cyclase-like protein [Cucumis melo var. makuwa]|uniref:Probable RNA 3'-terminal phosphate cyclase-like protein n=2 Tax=Cucumis melo TaxID=3656 RepID=A0A1S3BNY4_CUCME|nr:probable RNA 3'-terminal phosphate cyclase-like protein [Cucumis melo]TYK07873.1 putative RNA 3'-terminal phosphate cyclase-like protein [Cucumis melo var. makuwa]